MGNTLTNIHLYFVCVCVIWEMQYFVIFLNKITVYCFNSNQSLHKP